MAITGQNYVKDEINGGYRPGKYPGENMEKWVLPDDIRTEYARLNAIIETKYTREYLKICAFYNKLFPALRSSNYITSTYNVPAFTAVDQERTDTGTGISSNYLKQIIDQVVSRLGTASYEPMLLADVPTLEYVVYKEEVERLLRKTIRNEKMNQVITEIFHDASVIGFSHEFIDPVTHEWVKANDYEIGMFEPQFIKDDIKQMLYRNYSFPVVSLVPYLKDIDDEIRDGIIEDTTGKDSVDFKMYFDCPGKRVVITIGGKTLPDIPYNFDKVQMVTFSWDVGFSKVTATSLFDLLYPTQRELNRVNAKIQQLIRMYKGAVPVFNNDVDLAMKSITNGTGEALYVDSSRPIDSLMTVINPTPIDAQLNAIKTDLKTEMYELAGLQQTSFDMENFRSAAAVIAAGQFHDTVFQAQLSGIARYVSQRFKTEVKYNSVVKDNENDFISWKDIYELLNTAVIDLKPVVIMSPLDNKTSAIGSEPDYSQMAAARTVVKIMRENMRYDDIPYTISKEHVVVLCAMFMVKFEALNISIPDSMHQFMIDAFIHDMKRGLVTI